MTIEIRMNYDLRYDVLTKTTQETESDQSNWYGNWLGYLSSWYIVIRTLAAWYDRL